MKSIVTPPNRVISRIATTLLMGFAVAGCNTALAPHRALAAAAPLPANTITTVRLQRLDGANCKTAPVTFGQPFRVGDLARGKSVHAEYDGQRLPTQVNIKARNADGSARHAVITVDAPCSANGKRLALVLDAPPASAATAVSLDDVLQTSFNATFAAQMNGAALTQDARSLLERVVGAGGCENAKVFCQQWLSGPLVSEWIVGAPPQDDSGTPEPHLNTYFAVRAYGPAPVSRVRVDVVTENNWAYANNPKNLTYDATLSVPGSPTFDAGELTHYLQARWHQVLWWGDSTSAPLYAALDPNYLQSTPAVPSYEKINVASELANKVRQQCAPMKSCDVSKHMEITGAQAQIGPLPRWSSAYVIDTDYRLYRWMLANSDALGAYNVHYRDEKTGLPLSLEDHPCATTLWAARQDTCKAPPHKDDRLPYCRGKTDCKTPLKADAAHHPAPSYVAYMTTGDWYYASEMAFWANWTILQQNPAYRGYADGTINRTQVRGQAWILRTLGDAAYLLPDDDSHKKYFNQAVANNIAWYNKHYTDNPKANTLGAISNYHAVIYSMHGHDRAGIATWQQSFFTWAVGNLADQGFADADRFRNWVSRFQIGQMTAPGYCWEQASAYKIGIRDSQKAPFYDSFREVYEKSFPKMAAMGCDASQVNSAIRSGGNRKKFNYPPGTMVGYPKSATGFVANFQIGLAAAAKSDNPDAAKAWSVFTKRNTRTNYSGSPQFAVVPSQ